LSFFKDNWAGSHNFKLGYEISREEHRQGLIGQGNWDRVNVLNNGTPTEIDYYLTPTEEIGRMWTASIYLQDNWQASDRLTLNLGVRYDRYKPYLPAQTHPVGPYTPMAIDYPAVDNIVTWNVLAPRVGFAYKLRADGRTVWKANAGRYYWAPGYDFPEQFNQNAPIPVSRYKCSAFDAAGNCTAQGALIAVTGGSNLTWDPNLTDTYTDEVTTFVEHELFPSFGLRTGFVWRQQKNRYLTRNIAQAGQFTVPVTVQDPGPDGKVGTADDGGTFQMYNLAASAVGQISNQVVNMPGTDDYYSWEITGNKRMGNRWSLLAGFTYVWTRDNQASYASTTVRNAALPVSPNDLINTDNGRYNFSTWSGKISGTYDGPWDLRISPSIRMQSGQPFGRTLSVSMNYGTQTILTQPIDSQRMDNVYLFDVRTEKFINLGRGLRTGLFFDVYNLFNANPDQTIIFASGGSYLRPTAIVGPRIARVGFKVLW
jgi:outer membrane receptor protein involved in Fe transport